MSSTERNLSNLKISESFYRLMQTDPVDDKTLIDGTGSLVTHLAVSGTLDAFYLRGDGSQITGVTSSLPSGLVSSSVQLGLSSTDSPIFSGLTIRGTLTAEQYVVSSSVFYVTQSWSSGSTIFGNSADDTHKFTGSVFIQGPLTVTGGVSGSLFGTASWANYAITSSYIDPLFISASVAAQGLGGTSDWNSITNKPVNLISGSGQRSILGLGENDSPTFANGNYTGNVVIGGTLTARTYIISSSVVDYQTIQVSGSSKFGDSLDDRHQFTGSLDITGSIFVNGVDISNGGVSPINTGSFATTGSNIFLGNQVISSSLEVSGTTTIFGNIIPGGPYAGGYTSSYSLGTSQSVWQDLWVSDQSIHLVSGSGDVANIKFTDGAITFTTNNDVPAVVSLGTVYISGSDNTVTGSFQVTGSFGVTGSATISENLYVYNSTNFGNTLDDAHRFTGSLDITGSLIINGTPITSGSMGLSGTSGTSGQSGSSGTSGETGSSGSSGTSGETGSSGTSGSTGSSGTSGETGSSGTSGSSGSSGTSGSTGSSGTSGQSGSSGSSGSSGTGFTTISNAADNRLITSDGTSNSANAESNLTFDGSTLTVTGDTVVTGRLTAQEFYTEFVSASIIYESGSTKFGDTLDDIHQFTGSVNITGSLSVNGVSITSGGGLTNTGSFATTGSNQFNGNQSISGSLTVSQSINAYNINAGTPTSNAWQANLQGSYFNNFTSQTDVSEILRFIAGLLSGSAPDASPNTKTFSSVTATAVNTGSSAVTVGRVPLSSSNATILYLNSKGFAQTGSAIFSGLTIYTQSNYGFHYTSVAGGSTTVSSSVDAQLFGLGTLLSGNPTSFSVSGSYTFRFKDNSAKTDTATSSSQMVVSQSGAGTTNGVTLAKINTANPAVIPPAYQDGKFANVMTQSIYNGGISSTNVSASGYYHVSASILIASGSSPYTTPVTANGSEIFYAPLTTISSSVGGNTITFSGISSGSLTATSRSLSGAPYLSGSTYFISASVNGIFNPLYVASTVASITEDSALVSNTSGVTSSVLSVGTPSTISTANSVFDSAGTTARATSTIPFETDIVKMQGVYTFSPTATDENINQTGLGTTSYTFTITGNNKAGSSTSTTAGMLFHTPGTFGQPSSSGSLAYYGRGQGIDTATALVENFVGENYRLQVNDNVLSFTGSAWSTSFGLYNLGATDLQIKPGYLVKPGGTYAYWLTNPSDASDYKYYIRKFSTTGTKTSMTLNLGTTLVQWDATTANSVGALLLFESSNSNVYSPARFYDPSKLLSNFVGNISANTDGQNPFGSTIALYGNTGGSLSSTTYTIPIRNADGMFINSTYDEVYLIVRYKGDPTPITGITVTFS